MARTNKFPGGWRNAFILSIALLIAVSDQFTKAWIRSYPEGQSAFKAGWFQITHISNTGAAFGLFPDASTILTIIDVIGILLLLIFGFFRFHQFTFLNKWPSIISIGLVLGGVTGNLIDRLSRGYVTDFIGISLWPFFNIADSAITVGVILLAVSILFFSPKTGSLAPQN